MKKNYLPVLLVFTFLVTISCNVFTQLDSKTPNSKILFQDDFSDTSSGWDRNSWANGATDYKDNAYWVQIEKQSYDVWANPGLNFDGDISIEVDATKMDGENDDDYGLICRYSGESSTPNFYYFIISSDGFAVIGKKTAGENEYLSSDKMQRNDAIKQGRATNHLRADCIGSTLSFYVNGQMIASVTDTAFTDGDIGLMGGTFDIPSTEFSFDNLIVTRP